MLDPETITFPGDLHFTFVGSTSEPMASSTVDLDIYRIDPDDGVEHHIGCFFNIGSWLVNYMPLLNNEIIKQHECIPILPNDIETLLEIPFKHKRTR